MSENSKIEWTDHTFNPWWGCTRVSEGCVNCYAETFARRFGVRWGPQAERRIASPSTWAQPMVWNRKARREGVRRRVFCASMADVFEDRRELDAARLRLFRLIDDTPHLDWLLLTKRPENVISLIDGLWIDDGIPANVWIGTSVENQDMADKRIQEILKIPARVRFLSCEPLLGPVNIDWHLTQRGDDGCIDHGIDWVICGGESGRGARPMQPDWALSLMDQCFAASVPFFFKQWGGVDKHLTGRVLDGRTWDQFPDQARSKAF
jgi:protein gp37